jgi:hypothetical protein
VGWTLRLPNGSQGYRQATITAWLTRAGEHAQTLHQRFFCHLWLPHLQLDELRTRLRCATQVLWLWLAIDPCTKLLPVLYLGPRTQHAAHRVIHSLRELLAPGCVPLFTSDGLNLYFYALTAHFGQWLQVVRRGRNVSEWQVAAELIYGQVKKCYRRCRAGAGDPCDAAWNRGRSQSRLAGIRFLWTTEHGFHRASEFDRPTWHSSARSPHLGYSTAVSTPVSSPRVVASLLSFRPPSCLAARGTGAAARTRWQVDGSTRPPAYGSSGGGENEPTMDGAGSPVPSPPADAMYPKVSMNDVRRRPVKEQEEAW